MSVRRLMRAFARSSVRRVAFHVISLMGLVHGKRADRIARLDASSVKSILIIRIDLLGDIVFSMPAVVLLRHTFPHAHITMLTLPYTAPLARMYDCVDDVIAIDTNLIRSPRTLFSPRTWRSYLDAVRQVRETRFDLAISLNGRMASLCAWLAAARVTVGYADEAYPNLLSHPVAGGRYSRRMHEVEYARELALAVGAFSRQVDVRPAVPAHARDNVHAVLADRGIQPDDIVVAVHLGAGNGSAKRWPVAYWARFCDEVHAQLHARPVLIGGAGDSNLASELFRRARAPVTTLVGHTGLEELTALLERADMVVSGDSGPLHVAAALGTPTVAIFGPTDPLVYGPAHGRGSAIALRHDLPCSPCYNATATAECPLGDPICMRLVTVERVLDAVRHLLSQPTRSKTDNPV
ncbi:MAG: lipopolysaccharide heptosyltransferase II [Chloroflexota bacterium]